MNSSNTNSDASQPFIKCAADTQAKSTLGPAIAQFDKLLKSSIRFHLGFLVLGFSELFVLFFFFTFLTQSALLALSLAIVFLTFFTYFILRVNFQAQRSEQFEELSNDYVLSCKELIGYEEGSPANHISLANSCCKLANDLNDKEYESFNVPGWLKKNSFLSSKLEQICCWWLWQDVHKMKEILLMTAVKEYIKVVKCEPMSLPAHAALANAYVMLSGLYADPRKIEGFDEDRWLPSERFSLAMDLKFRKTAERAIEEFKIISTYSPGDPWVHKQLAYSYHDLQMPLEEIKEYETILSLTSDDKESLYKLGVLYFQQGLNAQGLRVYEELKRANPSRADQLINFYAAY